LSEIKDFHNFGDHEADESDDVSPAEQRGQTSEERPGGDASLASNPQVDHGMTTEQYGEHLDSVMAHLLSTENKHGALMDLVAHDLHGGQHFDDRHDGKLKDLHNLITLLQKETVLIKVKKVIFIA